MFTVSDMMTIKPVTLSFENTLNDAKHLMDLKHIRHIPIVSETGKLEGLVTQRDVLGAQSSSLEKSIGDNDPMQATLSRFLDRTLFTVTPNADLKSAAIYMQKHKIGCLLVVHNAKLTGIITDTDFVTIAINLLEIQEETESMPLDEDNLV